MIGTTGALYSFKTVARDFYLGDGKRIYEGTLPAGIDYVYCSTSKPTYISAYDYKQYHAHVLNPGGEDDSPHAQWTQLPLYIATCHNLMGPDYRLEEMITKAIQLGHPLNIPDQNFDVKSPLDVVD